MLTSPNQKRSLSNSEEKGTLGRVPRDLNSLAALTKPARNEKRLGNNLVLPTRLEHPAHKALPPIVSFVMEFDA